MTRRDPPARDLQDEDIRALLDAQAPAVSPPDLDERIRRQAHTAVQDDVPRLAGQRTLRNRTARMGSWMAVAAVVVLTVLLVPLLPPLSPTTEPPTPMSSTMSEEASGHNVAGQATTGDLAKTRETVVAADTVVDSAESSIGRLADKKTLTVNEQGTESVQKRARAAAPAAAAPTEVAVADVVAADAAVVEEEVAVATVLENSAAGVATGAVMPGRQAAGLQSAATAKPSMEARFSAESAAEELDLATNATELIQSDSPSSDEEADSAPVESMSIEDIRVTFDARPYRRVESTWRAEIQRLHTAGEASQVVREVRLFERIYPGSSSGLPSGDR